MGDKNPHNANKTQVVEQRRYLPNDLIIEEILHRLPVKSVLRFKSVSKQWYSTLSSSDFANAHLMRSPFSHPSAPIDTLFIKSDNNYYLFSYNDDDHFSGNFEDNLVKLNPDFSKEEHETRVAGSCNGLICLTLDSFEHFIIWNPATRKLHKYELHGYFKCFEKGHAILGAPGFGYVSSVDDYKYVEILLVHHGHVVSDCIVCIFSMRENRWRKIDYGQEPLYLGSRAMLVNEKLYWSAQSEISGARNLLLSFDLGVERFAVIEVDGDWSGLLGVMRGCLSKCNYREAFIGDNSDKFLHIMEPPTIVKSIGLPKRLKLDPFSEMIGLTKTGKYFVTGPFSDDERDFLNRTLGIVDTCTTPMQYTTLLRFNDELDEFEIARYVPSLVSPVPIEEPLEG